MTDVGLNRVGRVQIIAPFTRTPKKLYKGQLAATTATLYTAPAAPTVANSVGINPKTRINAINVCNTDTVDRTFTLYLVDSGDTASAANAHFDTAAIKAKQTLTYEKLGWILEASGTIQGEADSASKVTVGIYGEELT